MIPTAASTIAKYTHAIAEAGPYCQSLCKSRIRHMTTLFGIGERVDNGEDKAGEDHGADIGERDLQKYSHAVAPSIWAASLAETGMFCSAARKIRIWIPEFHTMPKMLSDTISMVVCMLSEMP